MESQTQVETFVVEQDNTNNKNKMNKKIFIPTIGTLGDVKPFVILAQALKKRGHTVWLGVHKRFQDVAKAADIDTVEIGGDLEDILSATPEGIELQRNPSLLKMGLLKRVLLPVVEEWFKGILSGLKDADLIVLSVGSIFAGLSCIEKCPKIKAIGIYTFPLLRTAEFSPPGIGRKSKSVFNCINLLKWKIYEYATRSMYNDKMNELRGSINVPPIKLNYYQMVRSVFDKPMVSATIYSNYLLSRPSDWQENDFMVGPIFEKGQHNFEPSVPLLNFLNKWKSEKIIYVGLGSMMSVMFGRDEQIKFLNNIQLAIGNNNCKAVISLVGFQQTHTNQFANTDHIFYLTQNIPHDWLFSNMSAAIHHGGAGTTHASLRYGLPTLILPFGADQPFNGDRVFINKLGPRPIPIRQTNVKNLTKAIRDLISDNYTMYEMNAKKIGELMRNEDGLDHCIRLIEAELVA